LFGAGRRRGRIITPLAPVSFEPIGVPSERIGIDPGQIVGIDRRINPTMSARAIWSPSFLAATARAIRSNI